MTTSSIPEPKPYITSFERLAYGLFLHWGLYSAKERGEWIQHHLKTPVEEYAQLIKGFTAKDFNAVAIAKLAREAGMRYIALTTRHHEGFSLYDTRGLSTFDAPHSPAGRDLVAEFVEACRSQDIVPFFYHTTLDWRWNSKFCDEAKFNEYLDYLNASVEVLCRHYGKIGGLWFDGNWSRHCDWKEDRLYATIRKYQPEAMIINNGGLGGRGQMGHPEIDSVTFEQDLPAAPDRTGWPKYVAGEMCETMNWHWGIARLDFNYKGPVEVIRHLCNCRKVGANYLLNVGPTADGAIPEYEAAVLRKVGQWISLLGPVIYEGRPANLRCFAQDFVLRCADKYYYFVFNLARGGDSNVAVTGGGAGPRTIQGLTEPIRAIRWMDNGEAGRFVQSADHAMLTLDCTKFDYGYDTVVRVAELSTTSGA
jgi:alpha-L-fucosidase